MMFKLVGLVALSLAASCVVPQVKKLPLYEECVAIPPAGETRCVRASEVEDGELPTMVPYAVVSVDGEISEAGCESILAAQGKKLGADLVYMTDGTTHVSGSVGSAAYSRGVAFAFAVPTYAHGMAAVCYRLAPAKVGVLIDSTGMVLAVDDEARKSGIIEGDHAVSIDGVPITYGDHAAKSPHFKKLLTLKPGQEITGIWIRPGTGRMEGKSLCEPNPPTYLDLPDVLKEREAERAEKNESRLSETSRTGW